MSPDDIPTWLTDNMPSSEPSGDDIIASRNEMYKTLELYHTHVKYVITIMFSVLTASFAIVGLSGKLDGQVISFEKIAGLVGTFLMIVLPLGLIAIIIIRRYYEVYVSALVYAVRLHLAANVANSHPWFVRTVKQAKQWEKKVNCDGDFVRRRSLSPKDSFVLYAFIIATLSSLSFYSGVMILTTIQ